jgi:ankyrin repeat protein
MYAAQSGSQPVANEFLQLGANADQQNADGNTALLYAAARGDAGMVKLLLEHGANPNLTNRDGVTPLAAAKSAGDARSVQQLSDAGARVALARRRGRALFRINPDYVALAKRSPPRSLWIPCTPADTSAAA